MTVINLMQDSLSSMCLENPLFLYLVIYHGILKLSLYVFVSLTRS